ncbi:MAG: SUMF1/EgtB/PvdO family nonheme iron enzyme [Phaeodactylibacter sp.]|nr:SUMF1/EgtB/PvdO family nonheme iron enzyme [Phaeodactylibacter sp.]
MTKRYPFKFLDAYNRADTDIFFGRDEEIEALYQMTFQSDILLVYGATGTGKTSLVNCGLASRFQAHDWLALHIRRGNDINAALQQKLDVATVGATAGASGLDLSWLDEEEAAGEAESPLSRQLAALYRQYFRPVYLIFDQFEELYILGSKAEQAQFIRNAQEIQSVDQPVKMIFVIREEYLGHLFEFERAVPQLLRKKLRVEPMNLDKVGQVVRGAAALDRSNIRLEAGQEAAIVEGIFEKVRGDEQTLAIQLPYLQVFLDKLYLQVTGDESRRAEALFTARALAEMGDIGDVLRDFLDEQAVRIQQSLRRKHLNLPEDAVWQILSPLATLEGTKEPMLEETLQQRLAHLPDAAVRDCLQALDQSRILRYDEQEGRYEVAHDSLAARIAEHRNDNEIAALEIRRLITSQMVLKAEDRSLFTEKQLNLIEPYLDKLALEPEALQLVEESLAATARRKRRRNMVVIGSVLVAAAVVAFLFYSNNSKAIDLDNAAGNFLKGADEDILKLDYEAALEKIEAANSLGVKKEEVRKRYLELAFWFGVSGKVQQAEYMLDSAQLVNGTTLLKLPPVDNLTPAADRDSIRKAIKVLDAPFLDTLEARYYPVMEKVNGDTFQMGTGKNDEKLHQASVSNFLIAKYETTWWQYALFCKVTGKEYGPLGLGKNVDNPVENVSWMDAVEYANWLSKQLGYEEAMTADSVNLKSNGFRLPTEAEWEFAARGGGQKDTFIYSGSNKIDTVAWYNGNSDNRTHPVGKKEPNTLKIYDMSGNVLEWCWDWYGEYPDPDSLLMDYTGPRDGSFRVQRGGAWGLEEDLARCTKRGSLNPNQALEACGFRLARSAK